MNKECNWIETRFVDLFSEDPEIKRTVDSHLSSCATCRDEVRDDERVGQLLGSYFDTRMDRATVGNAGSTQRFFPVVAAIAAIAVAVWIGATWVPFGRTVSEPVVAQTPDKSEEVEPVLAKPSDAIAVTSPDIGGVPSAPPADPLFYVVDQAGYAYTLSDFSGSVVVLGVFDRTGTGREVFGNLYDRLPPRSDLQFIAVGLDATMAESAQGVPFMVNRGSALLGTEAGEFSILRRDGTVYRRGTVSEPGFEEIVRTSLAELEE